MEGEVDASFFVLSNVSSAVTSADRSSYFSPNC